MGRMYLSRKSVVVWLLETARTTHPRVVKTSPPRLLCSTTLDRSVLDTLQFWIAIQLTSLANFLNLRRRLTVVQVRKWKTIPSLLSLAMLLSLFLLQASRCVSRLSLNTHLSDVLLFVTSNQLTRKKVVERKPNPPRRLLERSDLTTTQPQIHASIVDRQHQLLPEDVFLISL